MKRFSFISLFLLIVFLSSAQTDSSGNSTPKLLLEKGYLVRLTLARDVGSSVAQEGNTVYFVVDSAVTISGTTVIPKGTKAYGTVTAVREKASLGREGMFAFSINRLVLESGKQIALISDYTASGKNTTAQAVAESVLLSPLFIHKKGKDVTYQEGRPFVAFVAQNYFF